MRRKILLSLMAVFFMAAASAQTRTVRGSVVDENDTPVIGATVIVKDSPTLGTSTDVNGEFVLKHLIRHRHTKGMFQPLGLACFGQARCRRAQVCAAAGALAGQIHADFTFGAAHNAHQFFFRFLGVAPNAPAHRHLFLRFLLQMADLFSVSAPHCTACAHYSLPVSGAVSAAGASAGCSAGVSSSSP